MDPQEHSLQMNEDIDEQMQDCIEDCLDCHNFCTATAQHCLEMGGEHTRPEHIALLLDCAQICQVSADFMLRNSDFQTQTCGLCAEVCESCAQSCEQFEEDDFMVDCAAMCRQCGESCRAMAGKLQ